jgi:hypothetical protein
MYNAGINSLIAVTQAKMQDANDEAGRGAEQARDLMAKKKVLRSAKRALEADKSDGTINNAGQHKKNLDHARSETGLPLGTSYDGNLGAGGKVEGDGDAEKANAKEVDDLIQAYTDAIEDLESQEELGNMEIQDLMSRYNQAEQLAGSTFKKKDDADLAIVNKI